MREEDIELARTVHYGFMRRRFESDDLEVAASVRPQAPCMERSGSPRS